MSPILHLRVFNKSLGTSANNLHLGSLQAVDIRQPVVSFRIATTCGSFYGFWLFNYACSSGAYPLVVSHYSGRLLGNSFELGLLRGMRACLEHNQTSIFSPRLFTACFRRSTTSSPCIKIFIFEFSIWDFAQSKLLTSTSEHLKPLVQCARRPVAKPSWWRKIWPKK